MYSHRPRSSRREHFGSEENSPDIQAANAAEWRREALTVHARWQKHGALASEPTLGGSGLLQLTNGEKRVTECRHAAYVA
eukprot:1759380-Pleurochrysis_carterae.AAC.1